MILPNLKKFLNTSSIYDLKATPALFTWIRLDLTCATSISKITKIRP
jgi:hypothetical protein